MKKLYRRGTIHPSPPPQPQSQPPYSDYLEFLPAAVVTLAVALSAEDREVLAYLISCSSSCTGNFPATAKSYHRKVAKDGGGDHTPAFNCSCFRCYISYWVRWDSSPNRQLIHEIIDAFEDGLLSSKKNNISNNKGNNNKNRGRRERRKKGLNGSDSAAVGGVSGMGFGQSEMASSPGAAEVTVGSGSGEDDTGGGDGEAEEEVGEKGSVRRLVSFIGERIWGVWG